MPANTSAWSKNQPSGSSSIRDGDDLLRSDKSVLQATLDSEHYFDPQASASSASGGVHRMGSARVFAGTRASLATPASADSAGRLYFSTDLGSLHYLAASSHSTIVGGTDPFGAQAYSATTTLGSGASAAVILATENFDVGGYFTAGSSLVTIPSGLSGRYLCTATAMFPSAHTGTRRALSLTTSATDAANFAVSSAGTHGGAGSVAISVTGIANIPDGRAVSVLAFQDSGGNLSLNSVYLSVQKL